MPRNPDTPEVPMNAPFALPVKARYDKDHEEWDLCDADNDRLFSIKSWDGGEAIVPYIAAAINAYEPAQPIVPAEPRDQEGPWKVGAFYDEPPIGGWGIEREVRNGRKVVAIAHGLDVAERIAAALNAGPADTPPPTANERSQPRAPSGTRGTEERLAVAAIMDEARAKWMDSAFPGLRDPFLVYALPFADRILAALRSPVPAASEVYTDLADSECAICLRTPNDLQHGLPPRPGSPESPSEPVAWEGYWNDWIAPFHECPRCGSSLEWTQGEDVFDRPIVDAGCCGVWFVAKMQWNRSVVPLHAPPIGGPLGEQEGAR